MCIRDRPSFRLEKDVVEAEIDVLRELGVEFRCGVDVGKDVTIKELREQGYEAFYLAAGAWKSAKLGVAGEDKAGVWGGIEFLKAVNAGEEVKVGKNVAVIGGGNTAMDVARTAIRLGAENVYIVYRRTADEMPAAAEEVAEAQAEGVQFKYLMTPAEILGDEAVSGVKLQCLELSAVEDASGRRQPVERKGVFEELAVDLSLIHIWPLRRAGPQGPGPGSAAAPGSPRARPFLCPSGASCACRAGRRGPGSPLCPWWGPYPSSGPGTRGL